MTGTERALRDAERLTAVHEEALCSIDHREPGYDALRAATAWVTLVECHLRDIVAEVEAQVAAVLAPPRLRVVA